MAQDEEERLENPEKYASICERIDRLPRGYDKSIQIQQKPKEIKNYFAERSAISLIANQILQLNGN